MNFPIPYPFRKWRQNINSTEAKTPLIVEDMMPLTNAVNYLYDQIGGGGSRLIASADNINLKDTGVKATTTIVFDAAAFPSDLGLFYSIRIFSGDVEVFDGSEPAGFASNALWMDYVKAKYEDGGYVVVIDGLNMELTAPTTGTSLNTKIPEVATRDENAPGFTSSLSSAPAFSGGVTSVVNNPINWVSSEKTAANTCNYTILFQWVSGVYNSTVSTDFRPKIGAISIYTPTDAWTVLLATIGEFEENQKINTSNLISNSNDYPAFPNTGDWSFLVSEGTVDDFIINIKIFGDTI